MSLFGMSKAAMNGSCSRILPKRVMEEREREWHQNKISVCEEHIYMDDSKGLQLKDKFHWSVFIIIFVNPKFLLSSLILQLKIQRKFTLTNFFLISLIVLSYTRMLILYVWFRKDPYGRFFEWLKLWIWMKDTKERVCRTTFWK